jgi:hypothetical protein
MLFSRCRQELHNHHMRFIMPTQLPLPHQQSPPSSSAVAAAAAAACVLINTSGTAAVHAAVLAAIARLPAAGECHTNAAAAAGCGECSINPAADDVMVANAPPALLHCWR